MNMSNRGHGGKPPRDIASETLPLEEEKEIRSVAVAPTIDKIRMFTVWSWGKNKYGELSHGATANALFPKGVRGLKGKKILWISSGAQHSAVVTQEGELFVCGSYLHGKLGIEDLTQVNINVFRQVTALVGMKVKQVSCGDYHTLCLLDDGVVYTWGGTLHKKLGVRGGSKDYRSPAPILGLKGIKIVKVGCGDFHSIALTADGKLYSWGGGGSFFNRGQCGQGNNKDSETPEMIKALEKKAVVKFSCGGYHTLALTADNELYAWGAGLYGECGFGAFSHTNSPKLVQFTTRPTSESSSESLEYQYRLGPALAEPIQIRDVSAGGHHSLVLTEEGQVYSFGYAAHGQLGLHNTVNQNYPQLVKDLKNVLVRQIAAGWHHSVVMTERGDVYACGHGGSGQLGLGNTENFSHFECVQSVGPMNVNQIYAGGNHTWVVLEANQHERPDYRPPSPLFASPSSKLTGKSGLEGLVELGSDKEVQSEGNFHLQVSYTDLGLCHRFARFTIPERNVDKIRVKIQDYIDELKSVDAGVVYHRLQEDEDIVNQDTKVVESPAKSKNGQYYTLFMVFDPTKNIPPIEASENDSGEDLLGAVREIPEDVIRAEKGLDGRLSLWVKLFHKILNPYCSEQCVYFELRPSAFKD